MASTIFATAQSNFIRDAALSKDERDSFESTSLQDLRQEITQIQEKQAQRRSMRYLRRLDPFLIAMEKYGKIIEIFLNTSDVVAFIWGPMKFILMTASTHLEALDSVLDAYQTIGEHMPLLADYEQFSSNDHMKEVLGMMYIDILEFHREALRYFKLKFWRQVFSATWRGFSSKIKHLVNNMERHHRLIESRATIELFQKMCDQRQQAAVKFEFTMRAEEDRRRDVVKHWLGSFNNDGELEQHRDRRGICAGSGEWLLKEDKFQDWFGLSFFATPMLWMTGIPGAGKTVLASFVVDQLKQLSKTSKVAVAYFFCKFGTETRNSFLSVARSMLAQILVDAPEILPHLYEQASINDKGGLITREAAQELLQLALDARRKHGTMYLVIDGIDECERKERGHIASWFQDYIDSIPVDEKGIVRCLFVSQDDGVSRNDFSNIPCLKLTPLNTSNDIRAYVSLWHQKMEVKFGELRSTNSHVTNLITARAQGMFLFARLMVEHLEGLPSRDDLDRELHPATFPTGLDQAYDRIKHRMLDNRSDIWLEKIRMVLGWVACALRPLRWREIQAGVSIDMDNEKLNPNKRLVESPRDLFVAFVEVKTDGVVELIHRTARDYLYHSKFIEPAETHCSIAMLSMAYLKWPQLEKYDRSNDQIQAALLDGTYCFLDYASACWGVHLQRAIASKSKSDRFVRLLDELRETLDDFVDRHWSESCEPLDKVPKALKEDITRLCQGNVSHEIVQSVAWSLKQLSLNGQAPSEKEALKVWRVVVSVRRVLESLHSSLPADKVQSLIKLYGDNWFKCPRTSCRYYHEGFRDIKLRDRHVDKHDRPYLCLDTDCHYATFGFATDTELKKHLLELHGIDMLPDMGFPDPVVIEQEKTNLAVDHTGRIKCPHCDSSFTRAHNLKGHIRSSHSGEKPFKCGQCEKAFARSADRTRHERQHGGKKFSCFGQLDDGTNWGCEATFSRPDKREDHFRKAGRKCIQPLVEQKLRLGGGRDGDGDKLMSQDEVMLPRFQEFLRLCGLDGAEASGKAETGG